MTAPPKHIPSLDGVRAVAIGLVLLHHVWNVPSVWFLRPIAILAENGWFGVDVFFALSGFLITGVLLRSRGRPGYFRQFYARRAFRILPLYYAVATFVLLHGPEAGRPAEPALGFYAFVYNYWVAGTPAMHDRLNVAWSLCVEEHFYLVWPLVARLLSARLPWLLLAVVVAACSVRALLFDASDPLPLYVRTDCRMDALAMGCAAALAWHAKNARLIRLAALAAGPLVALGLVLVFTTGFDRSERAFAVVGYLLVPAATACSILALVSGRWPRVERFLSARPLRFLGRISFSLYLVHPLAAGAVRERLALPTDRPWQALGAAGLEVAVSIALATLTFRTIEAPMLRLKDRLTIGAPSG